MRNSGVDGANDLTDDANPLVGANVAMNMVNTAVKESLPAATALKAGYATLRYAELFSSYK